MLEYIRMFLDIVEYNRIRSNNTKKKRILPILFQKQEKKLSKTK